MTDTPEDKDKHEGWATVKAAPAYGGGWVKVKLEQQTHSGIKTTNITKNGFSDHG